MLHLTHLMHLISEKLIMFLNIHFIINKYTFRYG